MRNFQTWLSQTVRLVLSRSHRRIIFVGLDGSGKTTIINQIIAMGDDNQRPAPEPTVEFKVHTVDYKRWKLFITDLGGQDKLRTFWRHHFTGLQGIVFVIDSCDSKRIAAARTEFVALMKDDQLTGLPVLVFANKQDATGATAVEEINRVITDSEGVVQGRDVHFVASSGITGKGVFEGLDWLCQKMKAV